MVEAIGIGLIAIVLALPVVSVTRLIVKRKTSVWSWGGSLLMSTLGCYLLLLASAKLTDMHLEARVREYDLDGDGSFSGAEVTSQMEEAMGEWAADTGMALAPITALLGSSFYSAFWHVLLGVPYMLFRWSNKTE